jgi:ketosteroid isomerase-like protein
MTPRFPALSLVVTVLMIVPTHGRDFDREKQDVRTAVHGFLRAFENLDTPSFIGCFADDATVFFALPEAPMRFDGKPAIQVHFKQVFDGIRRSAGSSDPPFHRLIPEKLQIQPIDDRVAIVTFHMHNAERIARRTLVFQKRSYRWLITHLHASNVAISNRAAQTEPLF